MHNDSDTNMHMTRTRILSSIRIFLQSHIRNHVDFLLASFILSLSLSFSFSLSLSRSLSFSLSITIYPCVSE